MSAESGVGRLLDVKIGAAEVSQGQIDRQAVHSAQPRPFLGIHFVDCQVYGRLYPNPARTYYLGQCPKCGCPLRARIGEGGTDERFFKASCRR